MATARDTGYHGDVTNRFPGQLQQSRKARRLSQLELTVRAGTTQRHVSFIEQGRSRPGPGIVARLADALELSPRERNDLLLAAGFAPAFPESPLDDEALRPVRRALDTILDGHLPYPAMVVRPHGVLVATGAQPRPIARRAAHRARGLSPTDAVRAGRARVRGAVGARVQ